MLSAGDTVLTPHTKKDTLTLIPMDRNEKLKSQKHKVMIFKKENWDGYWFGTPYAVECRKNVRAANSNRMDK